MTCTVTLAMPGLSFAAADTRLNFLNEGEWTRYDARIGAFTLNSGRVIEILDGCRKIRKIGNSWTATTGDGVSGQLAFSMLQSISLDGGSLPDAWALKRETLRLQSHLESGFSLDEIDKTRILVAVGDNSARIEEFTFASGTLTNHGNFVVTWPPGMTTIDSEMASSSLVASFNTAVETGNFYGLVRAAVASIKFAAERCPTVGPIVQIGFAIGILDEDTQSFRIEGRANELVELNDDKLKLRQVKVE